MLAAALTVVSCEKEDVVARVRREREQASGAKAPAGKEAAARKDVPAGVEEAVQAKEVLVMLMGAEKAIDFLAADEYFVGRAQTQLELAVSKGSAVEIEVARRDLARAQAKAEGRRGKAAEMTEALRAAKEKGLAMDEIRKWTEVCEIRAKAKDLETQLEAARERNDAGEVARLEPLHQQAKAVSDEKESGYNTYRFDRIKELHDKITAAGS